MLHNEEYILKKIRNIESRLSIAESKVGNLTVIIGSGGGITSGAVDPVAAPANPLVANGYLNTTTGTFWVWNPVTASWA